MNVNEGHDLRKSTRDLFEAGTSIPAFYLSLNCSLMHTHTRTCLTHSTVLSVFCPPLHSGEGEAEVSERQSKLRTNLDSFIENLMVTVIHHLCNIAMALFWRFFLVNIVILIGHCSIVTHDGSTSQNMESSQGLWLILIFFHGALRRFILSLHVCVSETWRWNFERV